MSYGVAYTLLKKDNQIFAGGNGLFVSTDDGSKWKEVPFYLGTEISALAQIDTVLLAGTRSGLFRSTDNGKSWSDSIVGLIDPYIHTFAIFGSYVYAGTDTKGIFRSDDYGLHWTRLIRGLPSWEIDAFDPVYCITSFDSVLIAGLIYGGGIYRSLDSGQTWTKASDSLLRGYVNVLINHGSKVLAGSTNGLFESADAGNTWKSITTNIRWISTIFVDTSTITVGASGGVFQSSNNGVTWQRTNDGINCTTINTFCAADSILYCGTSYNGVHYSLDNGRTWKETDSSLHSMEIKSVLRTPSSLLAGTRYNRLFISNDNGNSWDTALDVQDCNSLISVEGKVLAGTSDSRGNGAGGLYESLDFGNTWTQNKSLFAEITSLFSANDLVFASTFFGNTYISFDGGSQWNPKALLPQFTTCFTNIGDRIFVGGDGIYSWFRIDTGLPKNPSITSLVSFNTTLFLGSARSGVYYSTDSGVSWTSANSGLNDSSVSQLTLSGSYLLAGTYSGAIWRRPISEMIGSLAVEKLKATHSLEMQAYPNPSSHSTTITFTTSEHSEANVSIVNILGQEVATLFTGELEPGEHTMTWNAEREPAGLYFAVVRIGENIQRVGVAIAR